MPRNIKTHPLMVFRFITPFLFFLLIPLARGLINLLINRSIGRFLLEEFITFILILIIAVVRWRRFQIYLTADDLQINTGVFIRRAATLPINRVSATKIIRNPFYGLFRAVLIQVNTESDNRGTADFVAILHRSDVLKLSDLLPEEPRGNNRKITVFRIILMAAGASSAATGLLIAVPIVNHIGSLINIKLSQLLLSSINKTTEQLSELLPPIIGGITILLLAGFIVSFLNNLIRTLRFQLTFNDKSISISSGWLFKYKLWFARENINSLILKSNPIFFLFRQASVTVSIAGYGNKKGENAVLLPLVPIKTAEKELKELYPLGSVLKQIKPSANTLSRFLFLPILFLLLLFPISVLFSYLLGHFWTVIAFLSAVTAVILVYLAVLATVQQTQSEFSLQEEGRLKLSGIKRLSLCSLFFHKSKIGYVRLLRFPTDRKKGTCNLNLSIRSENSEQLSVLHINYQSVKRLLLSDLWNK